MFAELRALVAIAETGSMERAANELSLTPSALTRRIQRLEYQLGGVLLDRHFKPPKLTRAGFEVVEKSRGILSSLSELKTFTSGDATPAGPFRLGLSHAVAQPEISNVIVGLSSQFPLLQPSISNDISCKLMERLRLGELDAAVVVLPHGTVVPEDSEAVTLAREEMRPVQARSWNRRKPAKGSEFYRRNWVLNPLGCLVREAIRKRVEDLGVPFNVAAELHNPGLQLSLIAGNVGVGILRASSLRKHPLRARVTFVDHPNFNISVRIVFLRARYLGTREQVAMELQRLLLKHLEEASG
ncbi:MAG TPA: LysR family transcriptional regulator [Candidatus Sulfotelmatobacter sp.]|nr:LysR family transcriptional regulator [Candidatus Sulfotelmatobacter sp.]